MVSNTPLIHKSVLVDEVIEYLNIKPNGVYVDATFGSGGHTRAILEQNKSCKVVGIDWDRISLDTYSGQIIEDFGDRFIPIWGNFAHLYKFLRKHKIDKVDGVLADFGTSQMQLKERPGFSFSIDTPLDMRMSSAHHKTTAANILNYASQVELIKIFQDYGEERFASKIAQAIVHDRAKKPFRTTKDLAGLIARIVPSKKPGIHPATKVFQALRIQVNQELEHIKAFLAGANGVLLSGGRIVCISFHSLEDRLVKNYFRDKANEGVLEVITPKAVSATAQEMAKNPSSRSARLRAAEKK